MNDERVGVMASIASGEIGFALFNQIVLVKRLKLVVIGISIVCLLSLSGLVYALNARANDRREALELLDRTRLELITVQERLDAILDEVKPIEE